MGVVYRALDPFLHREVALKVMLPQISEDPELKQRFEREARAVARLTHPNVVTVFDLGYHTDGAPYIVMELLRGDDLLHMRTAHPKLPLSQKVSIVLQVLDGLGQAHKLGIVHRDIKPANVFITDDGTAKIMDFGIARLGTDGATAAGAIMGTAGYMSPEQVEGDPVDGRSDLFSVGSMLCELLSGRRPFDADTPVATLYRISHKEPSLELPPGPEYAPFLPLLKQALARNPEDRFATAEEFAEALSSCLADPSLSARHKTPLKKGSEDPEAAVSGKIKTTKPFVRPAAAVSGPETSPEPPARPPDPSGLFRILRDVYVGGKSGHLHSTSGQNHRSLRILKGQITHAISDKDGEHLGEVLVRYGVISQDDLEHALEAEKRLGPVLSGMGLLDREGLEAALGLHVREIVFAMLESAEGAPAFEELADSASESDVASDLSTGQVILEATRRVQDPEMVRQVLGDLDRVLVLSNDPLLRSQRITLTPTDGFVLSRIDGTLRARDVIGLSPVSPEDTERSLFGLLCTGTIDYEKKEPTSRTRPNPVPRDLRSSTTPPAGSATSPKPRPMMTPPPPAASDASSSPNASPVSPTPTPAPAKPLPSQASPPEKPATRSEAEKKPRTDTDARPKNRKTRGAQEQPAKKGEARKTSATEPPAKDAPAAPPRVARPKVKPPSTPVEKPDPELADAIREAEGLFAARKYEEAIRKVEPLVPKVDGPLRTRASILLARGCMKSEDRNDQAEAVLLGLVEENPRCTPAYLFLGALYRSGNQIDRARSMYEKVLELEPHNRGAAAELSALGADGALVHDDDLVAPPE
jgi:serine/threonine protein kinase